MNGYPTLPRQVRGPSPQGRRGQPRCRALGDVAVVETPDVALVWLTGEIDLAMDDQLFSAGLRLRRAGVPVQLDAAGMTFADATLLGWLSQLTATVPVTVLNPSPTLSDLLNLVGLGEVTVGGSQPPSAGPTARG